MKAIVKKYIPDWIWSYVRTKKILCQHKKTASICESLLEGCHESEKCFILNPKLDLSDEKVIWQYWAQGYDDVPGKIKECLESVERFSEGFKIIRLSDSNLSDYLDIPEFVTEKRNVFSIAFFSDLLRCMLLSTYGGLWIDATVMLTAPVPDEYLENEYFLYQRDPMEHDKNYWKNTYAYYFGWEKGFRVNMLSSFLWAEKGSVVLSYLCSCMLKWWKENNYLPDYFFFQILYDVLINGKLKDNKCPMVSDCPPHYLQQCINDPKFDLMSKEDILRNIPIHKLTYK